MKFKIKREELQSTEVLEFRGEFEEAQSIPIRVEGNRVYFKSSFVEGVKKETEPAIILKREGNTIVVHSKTSKSILFDKPPKYVTKKSCTRETH